MLRAEGDYKVFSQYSNKHFQGAINSVDCETLDQRYAVCVTDNGYYFVYDTFNSIIKVCKRTRHHTVLTDARWRKDDKQIFCTSSLDTMLRIYDVYEPDEAVHEYNNVDNVNSCSFNWKQPIIAAAIDGGSVRLFDLRQDVHLHALSTGYESDVKVVEWSPKSEYILSCGDSDGHLMFFDTRHEKNPYEFGWWKTSLDDDSDSTAHDSAILGLTYTENGKKMFSLDEEGNIRQWDIDTGLTTMIQYKLGSQPNRRRRIGMCMLGNDLIVPDKNCVYYVSKKQMMSGHMKNVTAVTTNIDGLLSVAQDLFLCVWKNRDQIIVVNDESDWSD